MRFGIKTRPEHVTWQQMLDLWVAADDIEVFESAWNWDHFYPLTGDLDGPNLEGWTSLAALAQATRRIRVRVQHGDAGREVDAVAQVPLGQVGGPPSGGHPGQGQGGGQHPAAGRSRASSAPKP